MEETERSRRKRSFVFSLAAVIKINPVSLVITSANGIL